MNTLLTQRKTFLNERDFHNNRIKELEGELATLKQKKKELENKNKGFINTNTTPIIFYFGKKQSGDVSDNTYMGYFYIFASDSCFYRLINDSSSESENIIDVSNIFTHIPLDTNGITEIKTRLSKFVEHLITEHNPTSWDELRRLIKSSLFKDEFQRMLVQKYQ